MFFGLEVSSHNGPHEHHRLEHQEQNRCLNLFIARFVSVFRHVSWGSSWVTIQCIQTAKACKITLGRAKTVRYVNMFIKPKNCLSASSEHYSLRVVGEVWYFSSSLKNSMGKGKWNYKHTHHHNHYHHDHHHHIKACSPQLVSVWSTINKMLRQRIYLFCKSEA